MYRIAKFLPEEGRRAAVKAWRDHGSQKGCGHWGAKHDDGTPMTSCPIGHALWAVGMHNSSMVSSGHDVATSLGVNDDTRRDVALWSDYFIQRWDNETIPDLAVAFEVKIEPEPESEQTASDLVNSIVTAHVAVAVG